MVMMDGKAHMPTGMGYPTAVHYRDVARAMERFMINAHPNVAPKPRQPPQYIKLRQNRKHQYLIERHKPSPIRLRL